MKRTLPPELLGEVATRLERAHQAFQRRYPGAPAERQPVHVVYGGAHLFRANTVRKMGELALRSLDDYAPDFAVFAKALGFSGTFPGSADAIAAIARSAEADPSAARRENGAAWFAHTVYRRVRDKLRREPVEDYRIDFEDGYGNRPDDEEDAHAAAAAEQVSAAKNDGQLPPFLGIRVKPFTEELRDRSVRTLDVFLTALAEKTRGELPRPFYITLPKVTLPDEVAALADLCSRLEPILDLEPGVLRIEIMIETPQAILNERGEAALLALVTAARGRCVAAHFGPYDYTASRNIASVYQPIRHFASDFARELMQVSLSGTGIRLADGPTNIMPIPPYRAKEGGSLAQRQVDENRDAVHHAWKIHFENVSRSLANGFYQGWDLHPAQLPARYAAVYSFFLENLEPAADRLRNFIEKAAQATRVGQVFDDAAMAQGLLNYFRQAINSGAVTPAEVQQLTAVTADELRAGSFVKILENRK
ncbi:MAG: phosphoenolpyruvate kinase [Acidobacteriota bacterium]|nr:phosphoenolpyruvate kinase [Acidobacteriota bacterium]